MPEPICMKLGMYIMAPEPISAVYFINSSHQFVCLQVYPPIIARQWLGKIVTAAMNTCVTVEELLGVLFSMWPVSYQRKVGDYFPELLVYVYEDNFACFINILH
jgi:hypothetical protein